MVRIAKQPDVRKAEIVNTSQRLFYQRGYENTSVNEIVLNAGIAKGTFYHYFRSKSDVIDEEEFALIKKLKDLKKSYKTSYEDVKQIKSALIIIKQNNEQLMLDLINAFEKWYESKYGQLLTAAQKTASSLMKTIPNLYIQMRSENVKTQGTTQPICQL